MLGRWTRTFAFCIGLVLVTGSEARAQGTELGRYHALLIANEDYDKWIDLETPIADVTVLNGILTTRYGYATRVLTNARRSQIIDEIERYRRELTEADNLLVYYAGHGVLRDDGGYWVGIDAETDSSSGWIHYHTISKLLDYSSGMKAHHVLVIADSCYSGAVFRADTGVATKKSNEAYEAWLLRMRQSRSRTAFTSGGTEPVIDRAGRSRHSIFAQELIASLERNTDVLNADALYDQIKADVHARALRLVGSEAQAPNYGRIAGAGHADGDFLFVPKGASLPLATAGLGPAERLGIRGNGPPLETLPQPPARDPEPVDDGRAESERVLAYLQTKTDYVRTALAHFLKDENIVYDWAYEILNIWKYRVEDVQGEDVVIFLEYEAKGGTPSSSSEFREGRFVVRIRDGVIEFVRQLPSRG